MRQLKFTSAILLALLMNVYYLSAQDCNIYFPSKEGSMVELTQYDAKNKVTSVTRQTVKSKEATAKGVKINFLSESFNPKGDSLYKGQYSVKCENGIFYFDMNNFMPASQMGASKGSEMELKADNLEFPSNPEIGKTIKVNSVNLNEMANRKTKVAIIVIGSRNMV